MWGWRLCKKTKTSQKSRRFAVIQLGPPPMPQHAASINNSTGSFNPSGWIFRESGLATSNSSHVPPANPPPAALLQHPMQQQRLTITALHWQQNIIIQLHLLPTTAIMPNNTHACSNHNHHRPTIATMQYPVHHYQPIANMQYDGQ